MSEGTLSRVVAHIVKPGFTGVCIFSYFSLKHRLWVLVGTASFKRVPTIYVFAQKLEKYHILLSENDQFLQP